MEAAKFVIYQDFNGGYRWRLRSRTGQTMASSVKGHNEKRQCEEELGRRRLGCPGVPVRDATARNPMRSLLPAGGQA
ncbi:MAG: hypothetical protein AVDCRST_MAG03-3676 [uncultured Rubrobacteraceae bacterium]|uniref:Uncharacterized protein n=1 Tax=uncultured Rubrobacteraceae bacterium TaxID=349277 RepID=A0A6J4QB44_9ACTN|nr:MAG: hypothetical protein AVDCRST_MAG03-3676 [uncultured Rubrobacteraceae bacterium]